MLPVVHGNLPNAVVNEIDIYQPRGAAPATTAPSARRSCPPRQWRLPSGDPIDVYPISGTTVIGRRPSRLPAHPARSRLTPSRPSSGVRLIFTYTSPTLSLFTQTDNQYTVVRLAPME